MSRESILLSLGYPGDAENPSGIIPVEHWPVWLKPYFSATPGRFVVHGLFVGGCVARGVGSSFRHQAHAHCDKGSAHPGWICIRGWRRLAERNLILHELAHILTGEGHTDKWRAKMRELGVKVPAHYQKRRRGVAKKAAPWVEKIIDEFDRGLQAQIDEDEARDHDNGD